MPRLDVPYRLSVARDLPKSRYQSCLIQLQLRPVSYSWEKIAIPSLETMEIWAEREGVVCLHDLTTIDNPWMGELMNSALKSEIRKALVPSQRFQVGNPIACPLDKGRGLKGVEQIC